LPTTVRGSGFVLPSHNDVTFVHRTKICMQEFHLAECVVCVLSGTKLITLAALR
jgi:hypothetical protein